MHLALDITANPKLDVAKVNSLLDYPVVTQAGSLVIVEMIADSYVRRHPERSVAILSLSKIVERGPLPQTVRLRNMT